MWHLAITKRTQFGCLCRGDARCHSLIEWWLSWMEPPVFTFYEDMLMQIDANVADLSMQISHATTLLAFVLQGQTDSCECMFMDAHVYWFMFGLCLGCMKKSAIHEASNAINTLSPINSRSCWLFCMTHFIRERETLLRGLHMQQSKASDFWSLPQKPKYSLIIFKSFSSIWQLAETGSQKRQVDGRGICATL